MKHLDELLNWYDEIGVDETIGTAPRLPLAAKPSRGAGSSPSQQSSAPVPEFVRKNFTPLASQAVASPSEAERLAQACHSIAELRTALMQFDACPLKATAEQLVLEDGDGSSGLMIIGEAPGAEEDRSGVPFVGASGRLLSEMLAAIELPRASVYITNVVFWRPPGNRPPTAFELGLCLPFVVRQIELIKPRILLLSGNIAAKTILQRSDGITKLRGKWFDYELSHQRAVIATRATFHPAYLLRSPLQKREAWYDFLEVKSKLKINTD